MKAAEKNTFLSRIRKFIAREKLPGPGKKVLVAVSGGLDSMVLWHVLESLGYPLEVAHVNFGLRGKESERDEALVKKTAKKKGVTLHIKKVLPSEWPGKSLQERAREIRYEWFAQLAAKRNADAVFLAHHAGDQTETILLNLFRGTGIWGLKGILPHNQLWVRPLLDFSKEEILIYAVQQGLEWREDASNQKTDYTRNAIRLNLLPVVRSLFPGLDKVMRKEALRFRLAAGALQHALPELEKKFLLKIWPDGKGYDYGSIRRHPQGGFLLLELLTVRGFSTDVLEDLLEEDADTETRLWKSPQGYVAELKGNEFRIWEKETLPLDLKFTGLQKLPHPFFEGEWISAEEKSEGKAVLYGHGFTYLEGDEKMTFPLRLTNRESGDKIRHRGLEKKVSDLLTHLKYSKMEKERVYKLVDEKGKIPGLLLPVYRKPDEETRPSPEIEI